MKSLLEDKVCLIADFLSQEECLDILKTLKTADFTQLQIEKCLSYDTGVLRNKNESLPTNESQVLASAEFIENKMLAIKQKVEDFFNLRLNDVSPTIFAKYSTGHKFVPHIDFDPYPNTEKSRRISTVLFLNQETIALEARDYTGGKLTFYGLSPNPPFDKFGLSIDGKQGMLAAFRRDIVHEVTPITSGIRLVATSWYC